MAANPSPETPKGFLSSFTPEERAQIIYFVRFVATVLLFVLLAALTVGILLMVSTNGG